MPGKLQINEEVTAEENVHTDIQKKAPSAFEGATSNNMMVQASNLSSERDSKMEMQATRKGPLTFDMNLQLEEDEHVYLSAADDQAELIHMHWHYCLGHLAFSKLKQLALNGENP